MLAGSGRRRFVSASLQAAGMPGSSGPLKRNVLQAYEQPNIRTRFGIGKRFQFHTSAWYQFLGLASNPVKWPVFSGFLPALRLYKNND
jgi:hypothetical protein